LDDEVRATTGSADFWNSTRPERTVGEQQVQGYGLLRGVAVASAVDAGLR
jgi:hypothetical protein